MFESTTDLDFGDEFTFNFVKKRDVSPIVVKRKFPGPAGILPDRKSFDEISAIEDSKVEVVCSQLTASVFKASPWLEVLSQYKNLMEKYNIKWIRDQNGANRVHFLAAVIKSIEFLEGKHPKIKILLKDVSGEIQGTVISHTLFEKYAKILIVGSVIVLQNSGIICTNEGHYLIITEQSLGAIYCKNGNGVTVVKMQDFYLNEEKNQVTDEWMEALNGVDVNSFFDDF